MSIAYWGNRPVTSMRWGSQVVNALNIASDVIWTKPLSPSSGSLDVPPEPEMDVM